MSVIYMQEQGRKQNKKYSNEMKIDLGNERSDNVKKKHYFISKIQLFHGMTA